MGLPRLFSPPNNRSIPSSAIFANKGDITPPTMLQKM
jgi:hypothetical protein